MDIIFRGDSIWTGGLQLREKSLAIGYGLLRQLSWSHRCFLLSEAMMRIADTAIIGICQVGGSLGLILQLRNDNNCILFSACSRLHLQKCWNKNHNYSTLAWTVIRNLASMIIGRGSNSQLVRPSNSDTVHRSRIVFIKVARGPLLDQDLCSTTAQRATITPLGDSGPLCGGGSFSKIRFRT